MSAPTNIQPPAAKIAKSDLSAREALTFYNPLEEHEADKAPLQLALIRRIFRYTKPYAAKRNWLFILTFTRSAITGPGVADWPHHHRPDCEPGSVRDLLVRHRVFSFGAIHCGGISFPPAVCARTWRGRRARHAVRFVRQVDDDANVVFQPDQIRPHHQPADVGH